MKPRLFWTMLVSFTLVIVLGVCGMLGFFALAIAGFWYPGNSGPDIPDTAPAETEGLERFWAGLIADEYIANGNSWANVKERLPRAPFGDPAIASGFVLVDDNRKVIASNDHAWPVGRVVDAGSLARGTPVEAHGDRVGTIIVLPGPGTSFGPFPDASRRPLDFVWPIVRSFAIAGLALVSVLLVLAVIFAQRLSRPLRNITAAAEALAAGKLDVQVHRAPVRELDDLARAFNAMARSLAQADHQRRQMTADIAHELRTPLTIIKGRLEGLQDGVYSATPDQIERLLDETALLERLIEDLRLLALAEAGQLPLYPEPLEPLDLLEDAAAAFAGQAAAHEVSLRVEAPCELPSVNADPLRMAQVLANLVANALRYTPAGGAVTLCASSEFRVLSSDLANTDEATQKLVLERSEGVKLKTQNSKLKTHNCVVFQVSDTGQGIAPTDLQHIFERFWRADRSRTRGSGGAGLGLAIARQIVVAHGGSIWAQSAPGQGTTISVALPIAVEDAQEVVAGERGRVVDG